MTPARTSATAPGCGTARGSAGNAIATVPVATWTKELDRERLDAERDLARSSTA